jgi:predicted MFS family arabinose efflux permease
LTPPGPGRILAVVPWQPYHRVWTLLVVGWICNYIVRMAFSPLLEPIMAEFGLSHAQGGFVFSIFFYGYVSTQIPGGLLGDRFGRKRVLVGGILVVALAAALTGLAPGLVALGLARLLTGLAQGVYMANDRPIIATVTPPERLAAGQGISLSGLGLGSALGVIAGGALGALMPWRAVFLALVALPLLSAALIARYVPEPGRPAPGGPRAEGWGRGRVWRHRDLWLLGLAGISLNWTQWVIGTWGPAIFGESGVRDLARAALYASLLGAAAVPGLFAMGRLSDRLLRRGVPRKVVMAGGILAMAVLTLALGAAVAARAPAWLLAVLVFATSFFVWGAWPAAFALVSELFPAPVMGLAFGLFNAICFVASPLAPYVTGWIRDWTGSFAGGCYFAALLALLAVPVTLAIRAEPRRLPHPA